MRFKEMTFVAVVIVETLCCVRGWGQECDLAVKDRVNQEQAARHRVFEDPGTHQVWQVQANRSHPEGPARLAAVSGAGYHGADTGNLRVRENGHPAIKGHVTPLVRQGDLLQVSEESGRLHADFEAIALGDGAEGAAIKVRLKLAGKVMRAEITGRGRALLLRGDCEAKQ